MCAIIQTLFNLKRLIFLFLLFSNSNSFGQKAKFKFDFSIILGGCFQDDSVSININSVQFANKVILKSNSAGSANFSIVQDKKGIAVKHYHMGRFILQKIETKSPIKIEVSINKESAFSTFDLKKGKIIFIEHCWNKDRKQEITIRQQDYPVYFL